MNGADFAANGPFHHNLEQLSRTVWAPAASGLEKGTHWYYERARGSYADDKARQSAGVRRRDWEAQNPPHQKFSKTDLAKFEHAWLGLPHLVCLGAEKNFNKLAERMEDSGEPIVDQNYFKYAVAKAIVWRTSEKIFDGLELDGFRVNSVAYAVAWLSEKSGQRIALDRIWNEQRISGALCEALKVVCGAAHDYITLKEGNPGEVSKKEACWQEFKDMKLDVDDAWQKELADVALIPINNEIDALSAEWERIRNKFVNDSRTVGDLEVATGKVWMPTRRGDPAYFYAEKTWEQLREIGGLGLTRLRGLVELFSADCRTVNDMPDVFTKEKRSDVMSKIRGRGNKETELALMGIMRRHGIKGWRRHRVIAFRVEREVRIQKPEARIGGTKSKSLKSGVRRKKIQIKRRAGAVTVDFVFPKKKVVVLVDGCFWHGCPKHSNMPRNNRAFWEKKLLGNKTRDRLVNRTLRKLGWRVVRIWEHELKRPEKCIAKIAAALKVEG